MTPTMTKNLATYLKNQNIEVTKNLTTPKVALAIGAHPDDIEFGCGGTLAKWADQGCKIAHLVLTDGSKGSWRQDMDRNELIKVRQLEAVAAAAEITDKTDVTFLGYVDGELPHSIEVASKIAEHIRKIRPDVVLGHDPWKMYRLHPDHRNAGLNLTDAVVIARDPLFLPNSAYPYFRPTHLLLWEAEIEDHFEEIEETVSKKAKALLAHRSQLETSMGIHNPDDPVERDELTRRIADMSTQTGAPKGLRGAEAFKLISDL
jgi:LmbE family N-acetylglucosaminyl deacetylase